MLAKTSSQMEDHTWTESQWRSLVEHLVADRILTWKEVATVSLGELNPPQVGTSVATNKNIQAQYERRKTWQAVRNWFYARPGFCEEPDCRTRIKLEAEHIDPKTGADGRLNPNADRLDNLQLLCKRCNAKKRPSHKNAGVTTLTAEAALMWLLFEKRPRSYAEYQRLCRAYGLTMANIRFQEAWAMAVWLSREGKYVIDDSEVDAAQRADRPPAPRAE